jgi:hypothetical protein
MRLRLVAAAAGAVLIVAAVLAFSLSSRPVVAGHSAVEPVRPAVYLTPQARQCQVVSRLPAGADRVRLQINNVTRDAGVLIVKVSDRGGRVTSGELKPTTLGEVEIPLRRKTREAHPASICFSNSGAGIITLGGDAKRPPAGPRGKTQKPLVASAVLLRPGTSKRLAQSDVIIDRYANSQTGITGAWSLWAGALLALAAVLIGLWAVVALPARWA